MQKLLLSGDTKNTMVEFDEPKDHSPMGKGGLNMIKGRRSLFKQSSLINDNSMLKDVMAAHVTNIKPLSSFQHKPLKDHWKM